MREHELRKELNDEVHGRPGRPVVAPSRITHMAFTISEGDGDPLTQVNILCAAQGLQSAPAGTLHYAFAINGGMLKYERHGEFYRISVTVEKANARNEAIDCLPSGWLDSLPGKRLVAIHTHVLAKSAPAPSSETLRQFFGHEDLAGSNVNQNLASVWTDFRIGNDNYTRMLVHERGLTPMRLGRLLRRLHEIETYRMMALLAFPLARQLQKELAPVEKLLATTLDEMLAAKGADEDAALLAKLSNIARDVEDMSNRSSYRFAAARAYSALVSKRLTELGEERIKSFQRLGVYLERRFSPAMTTCTAVAERIADLARRSERTSNLLRTRVDIAVEGQNQQLLRSLEARARQQLMLQQTVEGLSVVAISYYMIGIAAKLFEGLETYVPWLHAKPASLISIPIIIALVWWSIKRVRNRVYHATTTDL
jgi:uncharacterized membrane-anchored protein